MDDTDKHARYLKSYKPNDHFWGIGIENETYLEFSYKLERSPQHIYTCHKAERYSVDYFAGLDPEYKQLIKYLFPPNESIYRLPIYFNAHSLQKTDVSGNHITTYEKIPKPNPLFIGKTIHEILCQAEPKEFKDKYKINYMFDGDTIEFMTQKFYNTTVKKCIHELKSEKYQFLHSLNRVFKKRRILQNLGPLRYPVRNEPFVTFLTNINNVATFNNGTYHINLTMPTLLDENLQPANKANFVLKHKAAIRYIQYLEPLIISLYGTPDPFGAVSPKFSRASQRVAASRYISIGTYDTDTMLTGKVLQLPIDELSVAKNEFWWYTKFHKTSNYNSLEKIGLDINFNKHGVHGIEIRFLDWFPEDKLYQLMETLVHLLDYSIFYGLTANPIHDPLWNQIVVKCLQDGPNAILNEEEYALYATIFNLPNKKKRFINEVYQQIESRLREVKGQCTRLMLRNTWF